MKSTGSWYQVLNGEGEAVACRIRGKFKQKDVRSTNPIAVGDWVQYELEEDGNGIISVIEDRRNYMVRKSTNLSRRSHIIASNIDRAWLVVTLASPPTSTGFIDRFLVTAEAYHIPVTILFNKTDVYDDEQKMLLKAFCDVYENIGYPCQPISALNMEEVQALRGQMDGNINLLAGHSGVGKSTLINGLDPDLELRTQEVSDYHQKGKHTTTFAEMFRLQDGGFIIDTPGIKGFGLIDFDKAELSHCFPEMRERIEFCQFNNCVHVNEPNCGIKDAVENDEIAESRYINYLTMYEEDEEENYR